MSADLTKLLNPGDIVRFTRTGDGRIQKYEMIYSKSGGGKVSEKASSTAKYDALAGDRFSFGYINKIQSDIIQFNNWDDNYSEFFQGTWGNIVVYDPNEKSKVRIGTMNDIITKSNSASNFDRIVLWVSLTDQKCMWIIK